MNLCAKYQIAKLSIGQEDNEEHDGKAGHILGTSTQCQAQLGHGLVEAHIFEYFDPRNKYHALQSAISQMDKITKKKKRRVEKEMEPAMAPLNCVCQ